MALVPCGDFHADPLHLFLGPAADTSAYAIIQPGGLGVEGEREKEDLYMGVIFRGVTDHLVCLRRRRTHKSPA